MWECDIHQAGSMSHVARRTYTFPRSAMYVFLLHFISLRASPIAARTPFRAGTTEISRGRASGKQAKASGRLRCSANNTTTQPLPVRQVGVVLPTEHTGGAARVLPQLWRLGSVKIAPFPSRIAFHRFFSAPLISLACSCFSTSLDPLEWSSMWPDADGPLGLFR